MVGIRFGGWRDEILTLMQRLGVITPPLITFLIFVPISPPPPYPTFLERDILFSNLMDHFICTFLYLVFYFANSCDLLCFGSCCSRSFLFLYFYCFPIVLLDYRFCKLSYKITCLQIAKLLSYQITWNCCIRSSSWILFCRLPLVWEHLLPLSADPSQSTLNRACSSNQ